MIASDRFGHCKYSFYNLPTGQHVRGQLQSHKEGVSGFERLCTLTKLPTFGARIVGFSRARRLMGWDTKHISDVVRLWAAKMSFWVCVFFFAIQENGTPPLVSIQIGKKNHRVVTL